MEDREVIMRCQLKPPLFGFIGPICIAEGNWLLWVVVAGAKTLFPSLFFLGILSLSFVDMWNAFELGIYSFMTIQALG